MPETLATADGQKIDLDQTDAEFAKAMAAPSSADPQHPAPPKRPDATPEAPYGYKADGTPRRSAGGRPPKPREIEAPKTTGKTGGKGEARPGPADYTQGLTDFTDALWMVMAATPVPWEDVRVRVRAQAYVLRSNQAGVVSAVNTMAQHNGTIRTGVEKLTSGNAGWVLPAVMALAPFAVQSASIWRAPANGQMVEVAEETERQWAEVFKAMTEEMAAPEAQPEPEPAAA